MNIVIDSTPLLKNLTGVGQVTYQHAYQLSKQPDSALHYYYGWYWSESLRDRPFPGFEKKVQQVKRWVPKAYWFGHHLKRTIFNAGLLYHRPDIIYQPNFIRIPTLMRIPTVTTVCDVSFLRNPEYHPQERVRFFSAHIKSSIQNSDKIVTISEFSKKEIVHFGLTSEEHIEVNYCGVDSRYKPVENPQALQKVLDTHTLQPKSYILYVGTLEPRKNLKALLKAYKAYLESTTSQQPLQLAIAGMLGWRLESLENELKEILDNPNVIHLGYVPDEHLPALYTGAKLFCFPSVYEGFGLPVLESMACGTPVICSNAASLPEVAGDAALLHAPEDIDTLTQSILALQSNPALYQELSDKGRKQAEKFSWGTSASQLYQTFDNVLSQRKP